MNERKLGWLQNASLSHTHAKLHSCSRSQSQRCLNTWVPPPPFTFEYCQWPHLDFKRFKQFIHAPWTSFTHVNYSPCLNERLGGGRKGRRKVLTLLSENMKVNREKSTCWGIFAFPGLLRQWRRVEAANLCCFEMPFLSPTPQTPSHPTPPHPGVFSLSLSLPQSVFCYKGSKSKRH